MRKEIIGIALVFLLIFTSVSLFTYHSEDPSINHASPVRYIHNLFGPAGAYTAGFLIALFGLGAYWFPLLFLLITLDVFKEASVRRTLLNIAGGFLLALSTGSLLAFERTNYIIGGRKFSSGGIFGISMSQFLERYLSNIGGRIFLWAVVIIGFILMTRFSLSAFFKWLIAVTRLVLTRIKTSWTIYRERRIKAKARIKAKRLSSDKEPRQLKIKETLPKPIKEPPVREQESFSFMDRGKAKYQLPLLSFLDGPESQPKGSDHDSLVMLSKLLEKKMNDFGVSGKVVEVCPGPVITTFEYEPAPGIKINKIVGLADDLALSLRATSIRIVAPIPGKAAIGVEIPNSDRAVVKLKEILMDGSFQSCESKLTIVLGKSVAGSPIVSDLGKMPHLLIAGATGTGKSVALNSMICSILYKSTPEEVKMIMIDPKRIELSIYDGIPHLITPVVTDPKKATNALCWAVQEMEHRYELMAEMGVRNVDRYNYKVGKGLKSTKKATDEEIKNEKMPWIVVVIDELADLMMVASRDVEVAITRLSQMARAAGIHLLIATQRPSVDVLTGVIKANLPARISFQVSSKTDSRTILDANGAESLLGAGDMLFLAPGTAKLQRIHGSHVSEPEIKRIVEFLKKQGQPSYDKSVLESRPADKTQNGDDEYDEKYDEAVEIVTQTRQASISMLQRRLRVGYNRAARMIEMMEKDGVVGPSDGSKAREVLAKGFGD
ncbi:MAG: DNA translocase FtsK 4TM domain-containing protein [Pseudomonadota bacterium]